MENDQIQLNDLLKKLRVLFLSGKVKDVHEFCIHLNAHVSDDACLYVIVNH